MRLIGMMDSPYVRRVAVSMTLMDLPFTHEPVSVFRHFDQFAAINPIVKAPSLVTDQGVVLMDSTLILEHVERLAAPDLRLTPTDLSLSSRSQRLIGVALAACEKTVQIIYEHTLRPAEKQHSPWLDRLRGQVNAAYDLLEAEIESPDAWLVADRPMQAGITVAVGWRFTQFARPDLIDPPKRPRLASFSARIEALPAFVAASLE